MATASSRKRSPCLACFHVPAEESASKSGSTVNRTALTRSSTLVPTAIRRPRRNRPSAKRARRGTRSPGRRWSARSKLREFPPGNQNAVGQTVPRLRKSAGISQKQFAAKLQYRGMDICESNLSRLESQIRRVQDRELPILASALGVTIDTLFKGDTL